MIDDLYLYWNMVLARTLETELQRLADEGLGSDWHFSRGQEAIAVGVVSALRETDYIITHHRMIPHAIVKQVPLSNLVGELLGKSSGPSLGRAGEMHFRDPVFRFMHSFQLVGTCVSVAAGLAWAVKNYLESEDIVAVFHGDAASSNGQFHEGLTLAAVQHVPLLIVCENNGLAGNVRAGQYLPTRTVAERAAAYGIPALTVEGNKVDLVQKAAAKAAQTVRENSTPFLLECLTTRLSKHKQGQGDLRSVEELDYLARRDPLDYEARRVGLGRRDKERMDLKAQALVLEAISKAQAVPVVSRSS